MKINSKRFAVGAFIAAIAGYIAGILTAPKSGQETRKDIKDVTVRSINEAEKQLKKLHTELTELLGEAKTQVDKLSGKAKEEVAELVEVAKKAKEKARELLSATHEGDADDKELHSAITEANKAIEHLKSYLKK